MLIGNEKNSDDYTFFNVCTYCQACDFNSFHPYTIEEKLNSKYSTCILKIAHHNNKNDPEKSVAVKLDESLFKKNSNLKYFRIQSNKLSFENPDGLFNDTELFRVHFENNLIDEIPASLLNLSSLRHLAIINNSIARLKSDVFKQNKNLKILELGSLSINQNNLKESEVFLPDTLVKLSLSGMPFSYIPFNLDACLDSLTLFSFTGIEWPYPSDYGDSTHIEFDRLLVYLNCIITEEQKKALTNHFDNKRKGLAADEIYKFSAFLFKKFPRLNAIPSIVFKMSNLTSLDLSFQAIKEIPDEIGLLKSLNKLILNSCIVLESLSGKIGSLPLKELGLANCLSLKTPPPEIVKRGTVSVLAYLKRLSTGSVLCKRTKLMLVSCKLIK